MSDCLLERLARFSTRPMAHDAPVMNRISMREAKDRIEAQAAEIEYWKAEARSVRKELKSEQKSADNAMDNYDAGVRRIIAQAAEIDRLRDIVAIMHTAFAAYADSPAKQEAITLAGKAEQ